MVKFYLFYTKGKFRTLVFGGIKIGFEIYWGTWMSFGGRIGNELVCDLADANSLWIDFKIAGLGVEGF